MIFNSKYGNILNLSSYDERLALINEHATYFLRRLMWKTRFGSVLLKAKSDITEA